MGCRLPSLPLQLVYAAVHLAAEGHAFDRLSGLADVARLGDRLSPDDWERVLELASVTRSRTAVWLSCALVASLLRAPIPVDVLQRLRPSWGAADVLDRYVNAATLIDERTAARRAVVKYMAVDEPLTGVAVLFDRIFPPVEALRLLRPEWVRSSLPLAYARHAASVLTEARRHLFRRGG